MADDRHGGGDGQAEKSFDERVRDIRNTREEPLTGGAPVGTGQDIEITPSGASVATAPPVIGKDNPKLPNVLLVCADCRAYYEYDEDWKVCPQCGEDLTEVEKA